MRSSFDEVAICASGCDLAPGVDTPELCISAPALPLVAFISPPVAQMKMSVEVRVSVGQSFCIHCGIEAEQTGEADFAFLLA